MRKIDQEQGYFVTIVPKTRSEVKEFYQECYDGEVRWKLLTKYASTRKKGEFNVYQVSEDFHQLSEGFKMFWYRSFEKKRQDKASRNQRITSALAKLEDIQNGSRRGPKTQKALLKAANSILNHFKVTQWIQVEAKSKDIEEFVQESPGKPGPDTKYNRKVRKEFYLVVKKNHENDCSLQID